MAEYNGKITIPKDTMLHVVNYVFNQNIKESTTKENILKLIPEIYVEENFHQLIKMLSWDAYCELEKLIEFTKTSDDIREFINKYDVYGFFELQDAMIVVTRVKYSKYEYFLNPNVIEKLQPLFNKQNRKIAERYAKMEKLIKGILYTYGVVEGEFFRKLLSKYMKEVISEDEFRDFLDIRLNLNLDVSKFEVEWASLGEVETFYTYLDEESVRVDHIAEQQKMMGLNYKPFSERQILKREEYNWTDSAYNLYKFFAKYNNGISKHQFELILKINELGYDFTDSFEELDEFAEINEVAEFLELLDEWATNTPQYTLCGYTPREREFMMQNNY